MVIERESVTRRFSRVFSCSSVRSRRASSRRVRVVCSLMAWRRQRSVLFAPASACSSANRSASSWGLLAGDRKPSRLSFGADQFFGERLTGRLRMRTKADPHLNYEMVLDLVPFAKGQADGTAVLGTLHPVRSAVPNSSAVPGSIGAATGWPIVSSICDGGKHGRESREVRQQDDQYPSECNVSCVCMGKWPCAWTVSVGHRFTGTGLTAPTSKAPACDTGRRYRGVRENPSAGLEPPRHRAGELAPREDSETHIQRHTGTDCG